MFFFYRQGRTEPQKMALHLSLDLTQTTTPNKYSTNNNGTHQQHKSPPKIMKWGAERSGERNDFLMYGDDGEEEEEEVLTERAAEIIEERVMRAPQEIQRLDNLVTRVRGQQKGISKLLYANIDQLRLELVRLKNVFQVLRISIYHCVSFIY